MYVLNCKLKEVKLYETWHWPEREENGNPVDNDK
jgi:hypothetical protein